MHVIKEETQSTILIRTCLHREVDGENDKRKQVCVAITSVTKGKKSKSTKDFKILHNGEPEKEKEREEHQLISGQTGRIE